MKICRPSEPKVTDESPFAEDALGREPLAVALTTLVQATQSAYVLNLDARWGEGKTTFLRMWLAQLKQAQIPSLYFNAWESDFTIDPMVALIGELTSTMAAVQADDPQQITHQMAKVRRVGLKLIRRAIPTVAKLATAGMLDLTEVTEAALGDFSEKLAEDQVAAYEEGKKSIVSFREELAKFASQLDKATDIPLVLVIDELDRCRPDYAIRMLEVIKHFFSVPGIFFVVATDSNQLANAVHHTYGLAASASDYLRRFFDFTLQLPTASPSKFVAAQIERFGIGEFLKGRTHPDLRYDRDHIVSAFAALFKAADCTLRDQEKCFSLLSIAIRTTSADQYLHPLLLCTLIVLRIKNPELYRNYVQSKASAPDVISYFSKTESGKKFFTSERGYSAPIEAFLYSAPESRFDYSGVKMRLLDAANDEKKDSVSRARAKRVADILGSFEFRQSMPSLAAAVERLDLVAPANEPED